MIEGRIAGKSLVRHFSVIPMAQSLNDKEGSGLGGPKNLLVELNF
jgi:hypothetical protein